MRNYEMLWFLGVAALVQIGCDAGETSERALDRGSVTAPNRQMDGTRHAIDDSALDPSIDGAAGGSLAGATPEVGAPGGAFSNPIQHYPPGWDFGNPSTWDTFACDFTGDGVDDYARLGGTYAHMFINNGNSTFSAPVQHYPAGWDFKNPSPWKTISGDFDGDGRCDYARLGGTYSHFFLSGGDGTFSAPVHHYPPGWDFGFSSAWEPIVGDFNADGMADYARLGGTYAHVFLSQGGGAFLNPVQHYPAGWDFGNPSSWTTIVGDFDGDGKTDYARLGATYAHIFLSKGDGTFSAPVQHYPPGWDFGQPSAWDAIVGDFDGDGKTDYARLGATYAHIFLSQGDGTFSEPVQHYPPGWDFGFSSAWEATVGDFNGDGKTDYARLGGTYTHLFMSNGDGTFSNPIQHYPPGWDFGNPSHWKTIVGRLNADQKTDYARLGGKYAHLFLAK